MPRPPLPTDGACGDPWCPVLCGCGRDVTERALGPRHSGARNNQRIHASAERRRAFLEERARLNLKARADETERMQNVPVGPVGRTEAEQVECVSHGVGLVVAREGVSDLLVADPDFAGGASDDDSGSAVIGHEKHSTDSDTACQTKINRDIKKSDKSVTLAEFLKKYPPSLLAERAKAVRARGSFVVFFRRAWRELHPSTPLEWGPHIEAVCFHVETQLRDRWRAKDDPAFAMRAQNLLINVAPRSLKSTILALACAWAWLHEPTMAILALSANPQVSLVNARLTHTLIQTAWYQSLPHSVSLNSDRSALTDFGVMYRRDGELVAGGSRVCRGLDSNITGVGSDWIQIDDPHDVRDSEENIRTTVEGYDAAVHNRINNPRISIRTAIMQRFRVDDFSGHMLEPNGAHAGSWLHVRIPTEFATATTCTCGTCVGTNVYGWKDWRTVEGAVVHPRFTGAFLLGEQRRLGPYGYAGQHQQEPAPPTGGMWKNRWFGWFRLPEDAPVSSTAWKRPPGSNEDPTLVLSRTKRGTLTDGRIVVSQIVISIDGTFGNLKEHEGSAVGLGLFARLGMEWLLAEDHTEPISYLDTLDRVRDLIRRWAHEAPMSVLVEPKAFGPQAVEQLRRDLREGELKDRNGKPVIVKIEIVGGADVDGEGRKGSSAGDKVTRFYAASPDLAAGCVRLREGAAYCAPYLKETGQFPKAKRDDRVDMTTQIVNHYHESSDIAHARAMLLR